MRLRPAASDAGDPALRESNYVDHTITHDLDPALHRGQLGHGGRIDWLDHPNGIPTGDPPEGQASFDSIAGTITGMFDLEGPSNLLPLLLDPQTGEVRNGR